MNEQIIDQLGGSKAIAETLGITQANVSNWRKRDIPRRYRVTLARMALDKGVMLPADFLVML
jgi:predicted transcriptional regulator